VVVVGAVQSQRGVCVVDDSVLADQAVDAADGAGCDDRADGGAGVDARAE
jgi:hypothetical protein